MSAPSSTGEVFDTQGRLVRLGQQRGRGGEGTIYDVLSADNTVAKIYHRALPPQRVEKIRAMVGMRNDRIERLAAWPINLLLRRSGEPVGVLMPKVEGHKDIHHLYSPKSRRADFQKADWRFLVRVAANVSRAFATVHSTGSVIGDVNHGSILVAQDARVRLIDCDSFQIDAAGRKFLCEVGVPIFTPPELQEQKLSSLVRTTNHDNFGLAVMIFMLLFMGRHPFAGRYSGVGDMPVERAIKEFRFAYAAHQAAALMKQPPGTPLLTVASEEVASLFERAFGRAGLNGGRPTALEWLSALESLEKKLKQCSQSSSHWYLSTLHSCPWCSMEAASGVLLFPVVWTPLGSSSFNLAEFWRQIDAVQYPGSAPDVTGAVSAMKPSGSAVRLKSRGPIQVLAALATAGVPASLGFFGSMSGAAKFVCFVVAIIVYVFVYRSLDNSSEIRQIKQRRQDALDEWSKVDKEWNHKAGPSIFDRKLDELKQLRARWEAMPGARIRKMDELQAQQRHLQLQHFLDSFEIEKADILGVGPGRKATLESYGVETAADILDHTLRNVPGFGPKLRGNLVAWRRTIEAKFRFDPSKGVDPQDKMRVEQEVLSERTSLENQMRKAALELRQVHQQIMLTRTSMRAAVEEAYRSYMQAVTDAAAVGG